VPVKRDLPKSIGGQTIDGIAYWSPGASSTTRAHELAHQRHAGKEDWASFESAAYNEIRAEKEAYELMGRPITYKVGIPAIAGLMQGAGMKASEAIDTVIFVLREDFNILVSTHDEAALRSFITASEERRRRRSAL
jgi:hypothetical protein